MKIGSVLLLVASGAASDHVAEHDFPDCYLGHDGDFLTFDHCAHASGSFACNVSAGPQCGADKCGGPSHLECGCSSCRARDGEKLDVHCGCDAPPDWMCWCSKTPPPQPPPPPPPVRKVFAWAQPTAAAVAQLRNATWKGAFDGVQAGGCGASFSSDGTFVVNETLWATCHELQAAVRATGGEFHVWTNAVPQAAIANPHVAVATVVASAKKYGFDGLSFDDETDCAPRSTLVNFTRWCGFVSTLRAGLDEAGASHVQLSAAVQAMFGIQDVPYKPACDPPSRAGCSQACSKAPWAYAQEPRVQELMRTTPMARWLEMDTYCACPKGIQSIAPTWLESAGGIC